MLFPIRIIEYVLAITVESKSVSEGSPLKVFLVQNLLQRCPLEHWELFGLPLIFISGTRKVKRRSVLIKASLAISKLPWVEFRFSGLLAMYLNVL